MTLYARQQQKSTNTKVHVFIAFEVSFDDDGTAYHVGVDSFAEVSLISPRLVKEMAASYWAWGHHANLRYRRPRWQGRI